MTRRQRLDLTSLQAAVGLAIFAALANGVWILLDHSSPSWDQAHYLTVTLDYRNSFAAEGLGGLLRAIHSTDPSHGPLFTTGMLPFFYAFGSAPRSGLILNLALAPILYVAAGQIAWIVFRSWVARLLTILLVATMPLMVGLYHNVLQDFLLVTLTTVSVLLLLLTDRFSRRWMSLALGLAMGLGTLTKVTFPIFIVGPLLIVLAQIALPRLRTGEEVGSQPSPGLRQAIWNMAGAAAVYLLVILPWYVTNFSATLDYVRSTTSGPLAEGAGPSDPLTFHAITSFTTGMVNTEVSWTIALAGLIAIALCLPALLHLVRRPVQVERLTSLAFLLAWATIPYLLVATAHNQDVRLMAPAMPAMAVIVAGAMSAVRRRWARVALIAVTAVALVYKTVNHVTPITPDFMPSEVSLRLDAYTATIPLDERQIGYEQLPGPDYATPVIEYIERLAQREGSEPGPKLVCILQSEPIVNANTFTFLATARSDRLGVVDVFVGPDGLAGLRKNLSGCDFALYVNQPKVSSENKSSRIVIVNEDFAARYMTPSLLALFPGPSRTFPVAASQAYEGEVRHLSTAGRSDRVRVLSKRPAPASCEPSPKDEGLPCGPGSRRG